MTEVQHDDALPFRFGSPAEFEALRRLLRAHGYTEQAVAERMGIPAIYDFKTIREGRADRHAVEDGLDALIRVFLDGEAVPRERVAELLAAELVETLTSFGLLRAHPARPDCLAASAQLYPTEGLYLVSDCGTSALGVLSPEEAIRPDIVYAAITQNTGNFLRTLPSTPCDRLLELCSGTGIAALVGAHVATHAWAVDVTARSTRFAEFNAQLNGIENVTALQGDLYEPVDGMTFDRIVAHPPYVPSPERTYIYAHAGRDGEDIIRGVIAGLPRHLRPGGRFYCTCASTDRRGEPLEHRVRSMLGEAEAEFDVLVIEHYGYHPSEFYFHVAASGKISFDEAGRFHLLFKELDATRRLYCTIVVQRRTAAGPASTERRSGSEKPGTREVEWMLDWLVASARADLTERVLESRPSLMRGARLNVTHRAAAGGWEAQECQLVTEYPFPRTIDMSTSAAMLIATFDGTRSARDHLRHLRAQGTVPGSMPEEEFARFVHHLVGEGALELAPPVAGDGAARLRPADAALA